MTSTRNYNAMLSESAVGWCNRPKVDQMSFGKRLNLAGFVWAGFLTGQEQANS